MFPIYPSPRILTAAYTTPPLCSKCPPTPSTSLFILHSSFFVFCSFLFSARKTTRKADSGGHITNRWVVFTTGYIHITLPCNKTSQEAWIKGGANGLILAADTAQVSKKGHITTYPSDFTTIGITIPLEDGKVPGHTVLHSGQCRGWELAVDGIKK